MTPNREKKRKRKRIILGVGYPWYNNSYTTVWLAKKKHYGWKEAVYLNIQDSGDWKKYKLVLEEI